MSFIGIAINIWKRATGGAVTPPGYILHEDGVSKFQLEDGSGFILMEH